MLHFFRDNVVGILILSVIGGVLAAWLGQIIPSPVGDGAWWRNLLLLPVPALVLVCYSAVLVFALVAITNRWRAADETRHAADLAALQEQLASIAKDRDLWRRRSESVKQSPVNRNALMRFVAVVLSDAADPTPKTHLHVCKSVAGLAGEGVPHSEISDALGTMLQIGAVRSNYRELELAGDWQAKLIQLQNRGVAG